MEFIKKLAAYVYDLSERRKKKDNYFLHSATVREDLRTLYPMQDIEKRQRDFVMNKLSLSMLILIVGSLLGIMLIIKESKDIGIKNNELQRNAYGEGASSIELIARQDNNTAKISIDLEERSYTKEELEESFNRFLPEFEKTVLGKNSSFDNISYDLNLIESLEGYSFVIEWNADETYIDSEGMLVQNVLSEPAVTLLTAKITLEDFEQTKDYLCFVRSRASPFSMQEKLQQRLDMLEEENREEEALVLPTEYEGETIVWEKPKSKTGYWFLLMTPLLCVVLLFSKDKDLHQRVEEREEQMKMDYPELVSKLALLLGTGMTVQNAWLRIVSDYENKKLSKEKKRFAYEEMLLTVKELKNGVYQTEALEGFGRRCRLPCFHKLATLLTQNLRSGSSNLAILLQQEATEAFEERKHLARRQGEKAGTKLLFPMMLFLMIVMVIIIVPTFISTMG